MTKYEIIGEIVSKGSSIFITVKETKTLFGFNVGTSEKDFSFHKSLVGGWMMTDASTGVKEYASNRLYAITEQLKFLCFIE